MLIAGKGLFWGSMTKITLNKVIFLAYGFNLSNLTFKYDGMVILQLAQKFDGQNGSF